ncbi:unnamed protein product [Ixodes persulcatus]
MTFPQDERKGSGRQVHQSPSLQSVRGSLGKPTRCHQWVNSEAPAVIPQGIDRDALGSLNVPTPYWAVQKFSNFDGVAYYETALEPKSNKISIKRAMFFCLDSLPDVVCQVYLHCHFVDDTAVRTTHEAEEALRRAASLPLRSGALSSTEISTADLTEGLQRKLCNQEDVIYSRKEDREVNLGY